MKKYIFLSVFIGFFLLALSVLFILPRFAYAQQFEGRMDISSGSQSFEVLPSTNTRQTITVTKGVPVNVILTGLNRELGKSYTLRVSQGSKNFDLQIPAVDQNDTRVNPCEFPVKGVDKIFVPGEGMDGKPLPAGGYCLGANIFSDVAVGILTNDLPCTATAGSRCSIQLLEGSAPVFKQGSPILAIEGNAPAKPGDKKSTAIQMTASPKSVYLGQYVKVTLSNIPVENATYDLVLTSHAADTIRLSTNVPSSNSMQCLTSLQGDTSTPFWVNYNPSGDSACIKSGNFYNYTAEIDTGNLDFTTDKYDSYPYTLQLKKSGSVIASTTFTVKNELSLKFSASPARGKSNVQNAISVDENVAVEITALGCTSGDVQFKLFGEPAGVACAQDGNCAYEPFSTLEAPASRDFATAVATARVPLNTQVDKDQNSYAQVGVHATCETTGAKTWGEINVYKEGFIQLEMTEKIIENYDKGVKGLEVIPILSTKNPIKFSVYGLRPGERSVGSDLFDRSNCFYVELYRSGVRLKRPANYPDAYIGQLGAGGPNCQPGQSVGGNQAGIMIDDQQYVFHIFDGSQGEQYENLILCAENACSRGSSNASNSNESSGQNVLPDGEYELKLYEARGNTNSTQCIENPKIVGCSNVVDSLVTSTTFQVGSAYHRNTSPPCKEYLIQHSNPSGGLVSQTQSFDSVSELEDFLDNHPGYFVSKCLEVDTAFGGFATDPSGFVSRLLGFLLSISGAVALVLIIRAGYQVMTSRGDPEKLGEARERLTAAIVGLLFIIFSLVILEVIGVDILRIPGFCRSGDTDCTTEGSADIPGVTPTPGSI